MSIHVIKIQKDYLLFSMYLVLGNIFIFLTISFDNHSILIYSFLYINWKNNIYINT
jgi:hypothetical protein